MNALLDLSFPVADMDKHAGVQEVTACTSVHFPYKMNSETFPTVSMLHFGLPDELTTAKMKLSILIRTLATTTALGKHLHMHTCIYSARLTAKMVETSIDSHLLVYLLICSVAK